MGVNYYCTKWVHSHLLFGYLLHEPPQHNGQTLVYLPTIILPYLAAFLFKTGFNERTDVRCCTKFK